MLSSGGSVCGDGAIYSFERSSAELQSLKRGRSLRRRNHRPDSVSWRGGGSDSVLARLQALVLRFFGFRSDTGHIITVACSTTAVIAWLYAAIGLFRKERSIVYVATSSRVAVSYFKFTSMLD
jgi:hypothetical protein